MSPFLKDHRTMQNMQSEVKVKMKDNTSVRVLDPAFNRNILFEPKHSSKHIPKQVLESLHFSQNNEARKSQHGLAGQYTTAQVTMTSAQKALLKKTNQYISKNVPPRRSSNNNRQSLLNSLNSSHLHVSEMEDGSNRPFDKNFQNSRSNKDGISALPKVKASLTMSQYALNQSDTLSKTGKFRGDRTKSINARINQSKVPGSFDRIKYYEAGSFKNSILFGGKQDVTGDTSAEPITESSPHLSRHMQSRSVTQSTTAFQKKAKSITYNRKQSLLRDVLRQGIAQTKHIFDQELDIDFQPSKIRVVPLNKTPDLAVEHLQRSPVKKSKKQRTTDPAEESYIPYDSFQKSRHSAAGGSSIDQNDNYTYSQVNDRLYANRNRSVSPRSYMDNNYKNMVTYDSSAVAQKELITGGTKSSAKQNVFKGAYDLSKHEHKLQHKLHSAMKRGKMSNAGFADYDSQNPKMTLEASVTFDEEGNQSNYSKKNYIKKELQRLQRNTITVKQTKSNSQKKSVQGESGGKKAALFFNPKYFDQRFDHMGNLLPPRQLTPEKHDSNEFSLTQYNESSISHTSLKPKALPVETSPSAKARSKSTMQLKGGAEKSISSMASRVSKASFERPIENAQAQEELEEKTLASVNAGKASRKALKKTKDSELLYKWAPGVQKKPISNKFDHMMERFTNPNLRKLSKSTAQKDEHNAKYWSALAALHEQNSEQLKKRERRILRAEKRDAKFRNQEEKGLRRINQVKGESDSSEEYLSSQSDNDSSEEEANIQQDKFDAIFEMEEAQIMARLAEEDKNGGDDMEDELAANRNRVEMTEKQRIRCLLMIQLFFAGLGDSTSVNLKDQSMFAKKQLVAFKAQKDLKIKQEQDRISKEKHARRIAMGNDYKSEGSRESESSDDESSIYSGMNTQRRAEKQNAKKKRQDDRVNINTQTQVQTDSKQKRDKLGADVKKILLFKDMMQSSVKGEMDGEVKRNQEFYRETVQQFSSSISAPTKIDGRKMSLTSYYLNEGVCNSLSKYLTSLTYNQIQVLELRDNGLRDSMMQTILKGMTEQRSLREFTYGENDMGPLTAQELSKILLWPNPTHLQKLKLVNLRTTDQAVSFVLSALKSNRKLLSLDFEKITLNKARIFDYLCLFVKSNKQIRSLRFSWVSFFPKQTVHIMSLIKRRKGIQYLDLSNNNIYPDRNQKALLRQFVTIMRRFILRTKIFHLDLSGMNLGKTVGKLIHSIKNSSTLCCIHLDKNSVPLQIVYELDKELEVPDLLPNKLTKFRPLPFVPNEEVEKDNTSFDNMTARNQEENNGNILTMPRLQTEESIRERNISLGNTRQSLKTNIDSHNKHPSARSMSKNKVAVSSLTQPLNQVPLIYHRILNHPEFVFPKYFRRKGEFIFTQSMAKTKLLEMLGKKAGEKHIDARKSKLDPRQDSALFSQIYDNGWSKIEMLTNKQKLKGKKGVQPDFSGIMGREGIVNTHHETCWVCEKRKYVLLSVNMDPTISETKTWGNPIKGEKEAKRLKAKYLPNSQLPGALGDFPILISSINDWFPIHMIPVVQYSMLFDYSFVQEMCKEQSMNRDTQDSVEKFKEGYQKIIDHVSGTNRLDPFYFRIYIDMWRTYILKGLLYPHDTLFIDFPKPTEQIDPDLLYMFSALVKPGKHRALLYDPIEDLWYKRDFYVDGRTDDNLPAFANYENTVADKGPILNSILKDWKVDNVATIRNCMEHDQANWNISNSKFIRDPTEYETLRMAIEANFGLLKEIFMHTASKYDFPCIGNYGTEEMSKNMGLMDGKVVLKDTINRTFIKVNSESEDKNQQNPGNQMVRFQFVEFIVRIASVKYKDSGVVKTVAQAFKKLIEEILTPYHLVHCQDWQVFRDKYICRTVIDHLVHANKRSLEQIFIKLAGQNKTRSFTLIQAQQVENQMKLTLLDYQLTYCWGMCQQTIEQETKKAGQYNKIIFLEFVEFILRIIYIKFAVENPPAPIELHSKEKEKQSAMSSQAQSGANSKRTVAQSDADLKQQHEKHVFAYKEFCCQVLEPFFEIHGVPFCDPDEDVVMSDSAESDFEYDLPSGYDSQDENNSEFISMMSSGDESSHRGDMEQPDHLAIPQNIGNVSMLNLDSLGDLIDKKDNTKIGAMSPFQKGANRLGEVSFTVGEKIKEKSARRKVKEILIGSDSDNN